MTLGLSVQGVHLTYGQTTALRGVDLDVPQGQVLSILGASGSGKSSLLQCCAGLLHPTAGEVVLGNERLAELSGARLADLRRRRIGFVFQFGSLVPELTLRENITLPLRLNGVSRADSARRGGELVERFGLEEHADRRPAQVSGGQGQRAAVARALAHRPEVVFADEPTGALDSENGEVVLESLLTVSREQGSTVFIVTHESAVADRGDRAVVLRDGTVVSDTG